MAEGLYGRPARSGAAERHAILVLGMHRSGTSALTHVLSLVGLRLPKNILGARAGNEQGHWEPETILSLHEELLREVGSQWYDWRPLDLESLPQERRQYYREEIKRRLADEYDDGLAFLLKEPRLCRFAGFYIDILRELRIQPVFVLPFRNPLAVIRSLHDRDGQGAAFASLLWLRHVLDAEASTRGFPRAIVSYEGLLSDWQATLRLISSRTGAFSSEAIKQAEADRVLWPRYQHHAPSRLELESDKKIAVWVKQAYASYKALETDPDDDAALHALDSIKAAFDAASAVFGPAMADETSYREDMFALQRRDEEDAHKRQLAAAHDEFQRRLEQTRTEERQRASADRQESSASFERVVGQLIDRNASYAAEVAATCFNLDAKNEEVGRAAAQCVSAA
ncbi:MAG: hypothetical protein WAU68_05985, partial [Vitreimonas sp.]